MPPRPLKPGTKIEFLSRHLGSPNSEVIEKAKDEGLKINASTLDSMRWVLRTKYGWKNTGSKPRKGSKYTARATKRRAKKKKAPANNGVSPERQLKHAALRKLVFDLGYDEAAEIFGEFQEMHNRWS